MSDLYQGSIFDLDIGNIDVTGVTSGIKVPFGNKKSGSDFSKEEVDRAYIPRGSVYKAFLEDQSPIVGLAGPAGTGKSRCALEKIHLVLEGVPGARAFIARKTRYSITESALFTYEEKVLPVGHPCLGGASRVNRSQYVYPNGSMLVVVGLDKPQKIMSTEFDIGYIQELIECEPTDIDLVMTRLRNGILSYQQLIFDVNPDSPEHWVYQYYLAGRIVMYPTYHEDNPRLWQDRHDGSDIAYDGRRGFWTREGRNYLEKLDKLTGPRFQRLRHGKWVAAEGAVYEEDWNPSHNLVNRFDPPKNWRRIWSIDFGFTHPFVLLCFAIDDDGRMWLYREIYITKQLVADNARRAMELAGWTYSEGFGHIPIVEEPDPLPDAVICDWDAEGRATFEDATGLRCTAAYKSIIDGIDAVKDRLRLAGDGLPRLIVMRDITDQYDPELTENISIVCTAQEFTAYTWDMREGKRIKDTPSDKYNHGMDAIRYAVVFEDGIKGKFQLKDVKQIMHGGNIKAMVSAAPFIGTLNESRRDSNNTFTGEHPRRIQKEKSKRQKRRR